MRLAWGVDGQASVGSVEELDAAIDRLTHEAELDEPFVVELVSDEHGTLSMGLGRAETVVTYVPTSGEPPYFASRGDASAEGHVEFSFQGSLSEYPREAAVAIEVGRQAMRRFFVRSDRLPENVEWQEV